MAPNDWIGTRHQRRAIGWGFVDQGLSSITNFGLSLLAGRLLGPSGLGRVFLAFSIYVIVLILQRSLVTEALVAITSALDGEQRARTAALGLTLSLLGGVAATIIVLILGWLVPGTAGTALLLVAPWLLGALIQDYWRILMFRDRRASAAAVNDGAWLLVMTAALPLAWAVKTDWAVISVWGLGACGGAALGFYQTRLSPSSIRAAWGWWSSEAWPFSRWNAGAAIIGNVGSNTEAFVVAGILDARALGGLRAVQSIFAPLSLIAPAIGLPGLPAIARANSVAFRSARKMAVRFSAIALAAALVFFVALFMGGWRLLPFLFGPRFRQFRDLIPALATGQAFAAAGVGFLLLIKAQRRGRYLLFFRLGLMVLDIGAVAWGAAEFGLIGAAWGAALVQLATSVTFGLGALREPRSTSGPSGPEVGSTFRTPTN